MNEQLQNTVNEILTQSMEAFNKGADWLAGEIPDVVEQLLMWEMIYSLVCFVMFFLVYGLITKLYFFVVNKLIDDEDEDDFDVILAKYGLFSVGSVFLLLVLMLIFTPDLDWLKIMIAPKLYLLEYAAELVR